MAFNDKEKEIIRFGLESGKSRQDVEKAINNYRLGITSAPKPETPATETPSLVEKALQPAKESLTGLKELYGGGENSIASKLKEDIQEGAKDIQEGKVVKGIAKAGLRTAGDVAGAVYAPVAAVVGATGIGKVFEYIGELSQKGGKYNPINAITDMKAVQDFVSNRPNLEEDFVRALNIGLAGMDKGKIDPKTAIERTKAQLVSSLKDAKGEFQKGGTVNQTIKTYENMLKSGDMKAEQVYADATNKIYRPEIARQIASDGVNNLKRMGLEHLASKYEQSFGDFTNVTPDLIIKNGIETINPAAVTTKGAVPKVKTGTGAKIAEVGRNLKEDILPTTDRVINSQISKAFDLTPGDLKNISQSTGNEVGRFVADNNLIGSNLPETIANIDKFYKTNYDSVRTEIAKVKKPYFADDVPKYKQALVEIKKQVDKVPGLEGVNKEVSTLLNKKELSLSDVQRAKELLDEHFTLYKMTGDVKDSVAKEGLANIRNTLKEYIESEVKQNTGADIQDLNNKVATSRSISDAIETRSTKAVTKSNLTVNDLGIFGAGSLVGTPLFGVALIVGKKIIESPTFRLKMSKWLDAKSDAQKAKIKADFEKGVLPPDIKLLPAPAIRLPAGNIEPGVMQTPEAQNILIRNPKTGKFERAYTSSPKAK